MNKLVFFDIRKNLKLFFGTFFTIIVTTCIISSCLNLVFSSVESFDNGHRFDGVDLVVTADQNITIVYKEDDGDTDSDSKEVKGKVPLKRSQAAYLHNTFEGIKDYSFYVNVKGVKSGKLAGHNISSMELSDFHIEGEKPSRSQIVVDEEFARINKLSIGDTVTLQVDRGYQKYKVSGIVRSEIPGIYDLQNYIFFHDDIAKENSIGCFSVGIKTENPKDLAKKLKSEGYTVLVGEDKGKAELPSIVSKDISLMVIFITMGSVCLVISMVVISGTVKFSIQNRFRALALLRVVGLTKGQVKRILTRQTLVIGFFGSVIGALFSIPVANLIIEGYQRFGIVQDDFIIIHSWLGYGGSILVVLLVCMIVTNITANNPLSTPPASAIKNEGEFTSKTTIGGIITGIILFAGGIAVLIFTPMSGGIGIGMGFCASSLLISSMICLTPLIIKLFNKVLSLVVKRFEKSLGQVAYGNINMKASKFAVAALSITIMMTMGNIMLLNNITYMHSFTQERYNFAHEYPFVSTGLRPYDVQSKNIMGIKETEVLLRRGEKLYDINALAVYGNVPNIKIIAGSKKLSQNKILLADTVKNVEIGQVVEVWLEDGDSLRLTVGGIYHIKGIQDENYGAILPYNKVQNSLYNKQLSYVYSQEALLGSKKNNFDFYRSSPEYDTQLAACLLLGGIAMTLSIIALFNTFAVIMSVRKQEFGNLRVVGAKKGQLIKMTFIETLIVTVTGLLIGFGILVLCVGFYSSANMGVFNFVVSKKIFYSTMFASALLGILAGLIPSIFTIIRMKRQFRVE